MQWLSEGNVLSSSWPMAPFLIPPATHKTTHNAIAFHHITTQTTQKTCLTPPATHKPHAITMACSLHFLQHTYTVCIA